MARKILWVQRRADGAVRPGITAVLEQVTIGFSFTSHWLRKWREFLSQSLSVVLQNQSKLKSRSTIFGVPCLFDSAREKSVSIFNSPVSIFQSVTGAL